MDGLRKWRRLLLIPLLCSLMLAGCGQGREEPQAIPLRSAEGSAPSSPEKAAPTVAASPSASLSDDAAASPDPSAAETASTASAQQETGIIPAEIAIPAIGVDAKVISLGLTKNGAMDVPKSEDEVGWFKPGYRPGVEGHAVLAGHVDSKTGPAIFFKLKQLKKGNQIILKSRDGVEKVFQVVGSETYPYDKAPLKQIFGPANQKLLNLITCTGLYSRSKGTHQERLVVTAKLIA